MLKANISNCKKSTVLDMTTWDEIRFAVEVENVLTNFSKEN